MPGRPLKPESKDTSKDLQTLHANRYLLQTGQRRCWILLTLQTPRTSSPRESWNSKLSMLRYTACSDFPFGPCPMAPTHTWKTNGRSKVKGCNDTHHTQTFSLGSAWWHLPTPGKQMGTVRWKDVMIHSLQRLHLGPTRWHLPTPGKQMGAVRWSDVVIHSFLRLSVWACQMAPTAIQTWRLGAGGEKEKEICSEELLKHKASGDFSFGTSTGSESWMW